MKIIFFSKNRSRSLWNVTPGQNTENKSMVFTALLSSSEAQPLHLNFKEHSGRRGRNIIKGRGWDLLVSVFCV